jgi:hypothetical protein
VVNKPVWADIGAASTSSADILVLQTLQHQYIGATWACSPNILVLFVLALPIGVDPHTFYNLKNFADFLNACSANILVLTGLQHQYIGAVQGESKCLQHHAYLVKRCLFNQLE